MKALLAAVLFFEGLVVALAIPVLVNSGEHSPQNTTIGVWVLAVYAVLLVVAAGLVRRTAGLVLAWVLQAFLVFLAVVVPAFLWLGPLFVAVWFVAVYYGAKGDRLAAENKARAAARARSAGLPADEGSVTAGPSGDVAGPPSADG
jgi:hypothetical protein